MRVSLKKPVNNYQFRYFVPFYISNSKAFNDCELKINP